MNPNQQSTQIQTYKNATVIETVNSEHNYAMQAVGDKCLILEDEWRSGNECQRCMGRAYGKAENAEVHVGSLTGRAGIITTVQCSECEGRGQNYKEVPDAAGQDLNDEGIQFRKEWLNEPCTVCNGKGYITCPDCDGIGVQKGKLVTPDAARQRTSTGVILSLGPLFGKHTNTITGEIITLHQWSVGDRVSYSNYAGTQVKIEQKVKLLFMREHEILAKVFVLNKDNKTEISDLQPALDTLESR